MIKDLIKNSKYISKLLRHDSEGLVMDANGWISVKDICAKVKISTSQLEEIVETNDKKRFAYNADKTKIRANQGHSLSVDIELKELVPPKTLFHGTSSKAVDNIMKEGLRPMSRQHVHLSIDEKTAVIVGNRHSKSAYATTAVLVIDSEKMSNDGYKFYLSENGVWLTDSVPTKYINILSF